jgi:hypothetical protein
MPQLVLNCIFVALISGYASRPKANSLVPALLVAAVKAAFVYAVTRNASLTVLFAVVFFVLALILALLFKRAHHVSARGWTLAAMALVSLTIIFGESVAVHHFRGI